VVIVTWEGNTQLLGNPQSLLGQADESIRARVGGGGVNRLFHGLSVEKGRTAAVADTSVLGDPGAHWTPAPVPLSPEAATGAGAGGRVDRAAAWWWALPQAPRPVRRTGAGDHRCRPPTALIAWPRGMSRSMA